MKKIRLFILTLILTLSFVCSAFAEDTSDTKRLFSITASNGSKTFDVPAKAVSCGYFRAPNPETKEGGELKAYYVIPKTLYPTGSSLSFGGNDAKLISNYGWTQEEIDFAKANFCAGFSNWGISYDDTTYSYNLNVDVSYTPDPEALKFQNGKDAWCEMYTVLKDYMTSLENWTEYGYQFPEPIEPTEPEEKLPNLTYKVSRKWHPRVTSNIAHYNFHANWSASEYEIYSKNPQNYVVEVYLTPYNENLSSKAKLYYSKSLMLDEHLSLSMDDAREVIWNYVSGSNVDGADIKSFPYYVMLRVASVDGLRHSDWHFYNINGNSVIDNGTFSEDVDNEEFKSEIPPTDDNNTVDDTALQKDPDGENTTASKDPSSPSYKENYDPYSLYQNMKGAVATVKDIASMISVCYQWLPQWLLGLIACSIGLLVVVGFIKIVL